MRVEFVIRCLLFSSALLSQDLSAQVRRPDVSKSAVEAGPEKLVSRTRPDSPAIAIRDRLDQVASPDPEPGRVKPGNVNWHADFETARATARQSKKPVLLFQLLGQLDEKFT